MCLSRLQKQLCNVLQEGLPICARPFADIARLLDSDEDEVLDEIGRLKKIGVIRRICAQINYHALGRVSTLVTAHVEDEDFAVVTEAINALEGVSHNYRREHFYNVWFTLQAASAEQLEAEISKLSSRFGIDFHSLPVERMFKLNVRFDAESQGQALLSDVEQRGRVEPVELNDKDKRMLCCLQEDLAVRAEPFDFLCREGFEKREIFTTIEKLHNEEVIERIRAVVDHRRLGFVCNVMFCCKVAEAEIEQAGENLARCGIVSHCYQRKTFAGWDYNLFAMMHGPNMGQIQHVVNKFIEAEQIEAFELLPTLTELKKQPVKGNFS